MIALGLIAVTVLTGGWGLILVLVAWYLWANNNE
jgi:hypothetical protein